MTKKFAIVDIHIFIIVDFFAQIIDGSLGMVYGINISPFLLSLSVLPAVTSANVHIIEVFTTATSGMSYIKLDIINRTLIKKLLRPNLLNCILEVYTLSSIAEDIIKSVIAVYLILMRTQYQIDGEYLCHRRSLPLVTICHVVL